MNRTSVMARVCGAGLASLLVALLAGCGGGGNSDASISGTVSGLDSGNSVALANNGTDTLTVSSNTSFKFAKTIASKGSYNVTVTTQPTGQSCSVSYGSGVIDYSGDNITNVSVVCTDDAKIGVQVSGLTSSATFLLTLQNDPTQTYKLNLSSSGTFVFNTTAGSPVLVPLGGLYGVSVLTQPATQVCTANDSSTAAGGVTSSAEVNVAFTCK